MESSPTARFLVCCCRNCNTAFRRFFVRGRDEAVATPGQGLDVSGGLCIIVQRCPDLPDAEVQPILKIHEGVASPDLRLQLVTGYRLAGAAGQNRQHSGSLRAQANMPAGFLEFIGVRVELEGPKANLLRV